MMPLSYLQNKLNRHADEIDEAFGELDVALAQVVLRRAQTLSAQYPTRRIRVLSGHGSLSIEIEKRHGRGYWSHSYDDETPYPGSDVFTEVRTISTRFQDHFNGYAALQCDFTLLNGIAQ